MTTLNSRRKIVLVVDDQNDVLDVVTRILEFHSFQVLAASSPSQAIRIATEYEGDIHLLLTDIVMEEMSGPDLAVELTSLRPRMHSMFMSGYADGKVLGADQSRHFIEKPFMPSALVARVRRVLFETPPAPAPERAPACHATVETGVPPRRKTPERTPRSAKDSAEKL